MPAHCALNQWVAEIDPGSQTQMSTSCKDLMHLEENFVISVPFRYLDFCDFVLSVKYNRNFVKF